MPPVGCSTPAIFQCLSRAVGSNNRNTVRSFDGYAMPRVEHPNRMLVLFFIVFAVGPDMHLRLSGNEPTGETALLSYVTRRAGI